MQIAKVVVFIDKIEKPFDYIIPCDLMQADVGWRVVVPFANQIVEAVIIGKSEYTIIEHDDLKEIIDVIGEHCWYTSEMFTTAHWFAENYFCTLATALRQFIPSRKGISAATLYQITDSNQLIANDDSLIQFIANNKQVARCDVIEKFGQRIDKHLRELVATGAIKKINLFSERGKPKTCSIWSVDNNHILISNYREELKNKRAQLRTLEIMLDLQQVSAQELTNLQLKKSLLDKLTADGYLIKSNQNVLRERGSYKIEKNNIKPNADQKVVIREVNQSLISRKHNIFLLYGVTGSGKTQVYIELAATAINKGLQVIVLVPEIALTGQIVARFKSCFSHSVVVLHSKLSMGERFDAARALRQNTAKIVIGARSAIFAAVSNIGLIIIDEEHEYSYKQDEFPFYNAIEVAEQRAQNTNSPLLLGSATPSIVSYYKAKTGAYKLLQMPRRVDNIPMPEVEMIDMRAVLKQGHRELLSPSLKDLIKDTVNRDEQAIILLNRRGYATFVMCRDCGLKIECPHCSVTLVYHQNRDNIVCHYCGFTQKMPTICPKCYSTRIRWFGSGTQKLEEELKQLIGERAVARLDFDTASKRYALDNILDDFAARKYSVLLGTQMVAKGHDFPYVTTVGILAADSVLGLPDYRSAERTFAIITQTAGRAGRGERPGKVLVQAYNCDHYAINTAIKHDYCDFYQQEIANRQELGYPPFSNMTKLGFLAHNPEEYQQASRAIELVVGKYRTSICNKISAVMPAPINKIKNSWRGQVLMFNINQSILKDINDELTKLANRKWIFFIDKNPSSIM